MTCIRPRTCCITTDNGRPSKKGARTLSIFNRKDRRRFLIRLINASTGGENQRRRNTRYERLFLAFLRVTFRVRGNFVITTAIQHRVALSSRILRRVTAYTFALRVSNRMTNGRVRLKLERRALNLPGKYNYRYRYCSMLETAVRF